jgi:hypothetical protein
VDLTTELSLDLFCLSGGTRLLHGFLTLCRGQSVRQDRSSYGSKNRPHDGDHLGLIL